MKYKVGDLVRVKSLEWYNRNKDEKGRIRLGRFSFTPEMAHLCGQLVVIERIIDEACYLIGDRFQSRYPELSIEDPLEEEIKNSIEKINIAKREAREKWKNVFHGEICPEISNETPKKKYPNDINKCCSILNTSVPGHIDGYAGSPLGCLQKLIICRNAYWKMAGEEMGLGKLWEPTKGYSWFSISRLHDKIVTGRSLGRCCLLEFPTKEMRDAFKENFNTYLEVCKEFL